MPVRVEDIAQQVDAIVPTATAGGVLNYFLSEPHLFALPVVSSGAPLGIITRSAVTEALAGPNGHSLFGARPIVYLMGSQPVMAEVGTPVALIAKLASDEESAALTDGVIVLNNGQYAGLIAPRDLLTSVANENAARARAMQKRKQHAKKAQAYAAESAKEKARFMAFVSHEIRTPLTGILGVADLLQDSVKKDSSRRMARTISDSGQHLDRLLCDLLDLSRLEAGKLPIHPAPFSLSDFAYEAKSLWQSRVNDRRLDLKIIIDPSAEKRIEADATRIRQILFNLMSNALKFTEKGYVQVKLATVKSDAGLHLEMSVADTGCGISKSDKQRMFDAFEQVAPNTAHKHGGSGLGLSIAKSLAHLMGGAISLNDNPGGGSIFTVTLPVIVAGPRLALSQIEKPKRWSMTLGKLLLVEDHEASAFVISRALEAAGWTVDHCENVQDAIQCATHTEYQAILTDVHLGAHSGDDLISYVRTNDTRNRITPVIAVTADVSNERKTLCDQLGYAHLIAKPIRPRTLIAALADILIAQDSRLSGNRLTARIS